MSIHPGLLGKYELRERLGQGGMAEVWKAYDQRLQRFVAIKFLHTMLQADPTFLSRFLREARAVASLRHPNIVQVYDFETSAPGGSVSQNQPLAYMVMDYIEGQNLADYLAQTVYARRFLSPTEIVSLFLSISSAVDYAHQQGLLHRDIKPANILLDRRNTEYNAVGEPILTDFGIVKIQGSSAATLTSSAMGTPLYIAPEQALGQPLDAASDLYSLGVVLYEICTGNLPFVGSTPVAIIQQHISTLPLLPSSVNPALPPALDAVIMRALAKKPVDRFPSAMALTTALAQAFNVPLPTRQSQSGANHTQLENVPVVNNSPLSSEQDISDMPTAISEQPYLKTQRARDSVLDESAPTRAAEEPSRDVGPFSAGILSVRLSSTPPRPFSELQPPQALPPLPPQAKPRRKPRVFLIAASICALLLLLGAGVAVYIHTQASAVSSQMVGTAFFTSSGSGLGSENQGVNDIFQVRLTNIPTPAAGTQYYAWLLPDQIQSEASARALGTLNVSGGGATLNKPYIDPQNANLIATFSRFLVTQEPTNPTPTSPSLNVALWRYEAVIPQSAVSSDCQGTNLNQLSALCHLRHLLSGDPELAQVHLQGGLNYWFLNNVKEVQKWSQEAVDHDGAIDVRHKIANILYLLDGNACAAQDLMQGAPGADNVPDDMTIHSLAAIPLMDCAQTPNSPGYLSHIHNHLNAMIQSPGIQQDQVAMAQQIGTELNTINTWLQEFHNDARALLAMSDEQLVQQAALNKRHELNALATNILSGGTDPATGMTDKGAANISDQVQQMATLDVMVFVGHTTTNQ